ncbi:PepSY-associated TM helix domain-containing protein [Nocardia gipuzkoensis]|uniref:PepSY-associated TM helix domain-containing protein n=1 Tax=Nocardia gipuzkoensis TaxID=2749991 RepID=UPI00237D5989|nr:PepSY domain-containing protein [Nocardia gipuzkoensis]MDE1669893.1 PepSY domain-containing protein [Nocardia gipuzkoensis]
MTVSTTETITSDADLPEPSASPAARRTTARNSLYALAMRLHFYAGVFVGPFVLIAAVTGALYAISPTLESIVSRDLLTVTQTGTPKPLTEQVGAAVATRPDLHLVAVAPAGGAEDTTRVLFSDPSLGESERRAVFVNPYTAQPVGDSVVYGSSGALPMRTWIDRLHRDLHLGEPGRLYSELAASWLWLVALAGLIVWVRRVRGRRARNGWGRLFAADRSQRARGRTMNWHGAVGTWVLPLVLLLSATGMTWSTYAGENITELREQLSWTTPAVSTALPGTVASGHDSGSDHHGGGHTEHAPADSTDRIAQLDRVYATARAEGITQAAEIAVPAAPGNAFVVKERRMPGTYTVDAVAVDGASGAVTDRLAYADWPLMAKLTNWGIQFHMGLLFGLLNQLLLLAAMIGLITVVVRGYLMWWRRRPTRDAGRFALGRAPRRGALRKTSLWVVVPLVAAALVVGWFVPLVGVSLLAFLAIDALIGLAGRMRATA